MKIQLPIMFIFAATVALSGCNPSISGGSKEASAGSADYSVFVALGDSLSAGYANGALYRSGQQNSFPAILAQQFALVGGGAFSQPLMPVGATGSMTLTGIGNLGLADQLVLAATGDPDNPLAPATIMPTQSTSIDVPLGGPFNNMGSPGAKFYHLAIDTYGNPAELPNANPYFIRSASSTGATMLGDTLMQMPTFFVLWIGNNDVLGYATSGGTGVDQTGNPDPASYGPDDITDPAIFASGGTGGVPSYATVVAAIKGATAKGVLVNVPNVATIPYFTTVPYNPVPLDQATATQVNTAYAPYNTLVQTRVGLAAGPAPGGACGITQAEADQRMINFVAGDQNAVVILDENLTDITSCFPPVTNMRQATAQDFILLPASRKIGTLQDPMNPASVWGVGVPLLDGDVLTETEFGLVETASSAYNATMKAVADADPDLAYYDAAAALDELNESGINYGTGTVTSTFATGGAFSLDGVHPTPRGYAVIANEIFEVINTQFDAFIPPVDPNGYTTVPIQ